MATPKKMTKSETLQTRAEEWCQQTGNSSINIAEVASWLMRERGWVPQQSDALKLLKQELQRALREQYIDDPQGRRVRQKHPERKTIKMKDGSQEQMVLWHDIRKATRPEMQAAFQQRRFGIVLDCHRLKTDVDSYNENWNKSTAIQMEFDFTDDMADLDFDTGDETDYDGES